MDKEAAEKLGHGWNVAREGRQSVYHSAINALMALPDGTYAVSDDGEAVIGVADGRALTVAADDGAILTVSYPLERVIVSVKEAAADSSGFGVVRRRIWMFRYLDASTDETRIAWQTITGRVQTLNGDDDADDRELLAREIAGNCGWTVAFRSQ